MMRVLFSHGEEEASTGAPAQLMTKQAGGNELMFWQQTALIN